MSVPTSQSLPRNLAIIGFASVLGILGWYLIYLLLQTTAYWLAPALHGLIVGLMVKRFGREVDTTTKLISAIGTGIGCWLAYTLLYVTAIKFVDPTYSPTITDGMRDFFNWQMMVLMTVVGAIIAWSLSNQDHSPPTTSAR
jgi:hypothetical protein